MKRLLGKTVSFVFRVYLRFVTGQSRTSFYISEGDRTYPFFYWLYDIESTIGKEMTIVGYSK